MGHKQGTVREYISDADFLPNKYSVMKNFALLDFFHNEAAVEFYLDKPEHSVRGDAV